jgi:hypothetical protein
VNWYKRAVRKIYIPAKEYDKLQTIIEKIVNGDRNWSPEELQIQQNYPEAVEVLLKKRTIAACSCNSSCGLKIH